jgi:hypothetical protein
VKVFISYSRRDEAAVRSLAEDLRQRARVQVWMDEQLGGGDAWWTAILGEIRESTVFVFALSDKSLYSKPCKAELGYATALGVPILPVQIGEVASFHIDPIFTMQLVDYRNPTIKSAFDLVSSLHSRAAQHSDLPDPLPEPPPIPYEYLHRLGAQIHDTGTMLAPPAQVQMLFELRSALSEEDDPIVLDDIRNLLRALRRRADLNWMTASEIDTTLSQGVGVSRAPVSAVPEDGLAVIPADTPVATDAGRNAPPADAPSATAPETGRYVEPDAEAVASEAPADQVSDQPISSTERPESTSQTDADLRSTSTESGAVAATEPRSPVTNSAEAESESAVPQAHTGFGPPTDTTPDAAKTSFFQAMSRRTKIVVGVVTAIIALAVVVGVVIASQPSSGGGVASPTSTTQFTSAGATTEATTSPSAGQPSDPNQRLLAMLPSGLHCYGGMASSEPGAIARADCSLGDSRISRLAYWLFPDQNAMASAFNSNPAPYWLVACPALGSSPQEWHRAATPQQPEGQLRCGSSSGPTANLTWTIDSQFVLGGLSSANPGSIDPLYQWWASHYAQ